MQTALSWRTPTSAAPNNDTPSKAEWAYSSVSTFGLRYNPPWPNLTTPELVEALVEGSEMSMLRDGQGSVKEAWERRPSRSMRFENKRLGGTVVVHFIKKSSWYLETAIAMLGGLDLT